jgi:hypothetical protein
MWFVFGDSLLAIGAAFMMQSLSLLAIGNNSQANFAGYLGLILMLVGAIVAIGSLLLGETGQASGMSTESRVPLNR